MTPALRHVGTSRSPLVTVDAFVPHPTELIEVAAAMAPFPPDRATAYPGLRREVTPADAVAWEHVAHVLEAASPFIGGAFDVDRFDLLGASFSMVTAHADALSLAQRMPHFDSTDPGYLALLLYLRDTGGTAFYRQRSTSIETVTEDNRTAFLSVARLQSVGMQGYISGSGPAFERIDAVEGHAGRLAIYQGRLLHSGIITADEDLSDDPHTGRLTLNLFIQAR
jgi:hypothetical protein